MWRDLDMSPAMFVTFASLILFCKFALDQGHVPCLTRKKS